MKNKNVYEQIIESLINDDEARARELFHAEIVRQSRDIYNQLVVEEAEEEEEEEEMEESFGSFGERGMSTDQTDDMLSDIGHDEEGMGHEMGDHDEQGEMGMDDMGSHDEGSIEDRVVDLEDALDELRAEFEELMADEEGEEEHDDMDFGSEEDDEMQEGMVREYVEKVSKPGNTEGQGVGAGSIGGSTNSKSIVAGKNDMGGKAFALGKGAEQNPDDKQYSKPSNQYSKGEGNLPGAGSFENVPGAKAGKTFKNAKKPVTSEVAGTNDKPMLKRQ